jgi:hypothetical protein
VLLRLAYPTVTNTFAALRLLSMGDRDKDVEILALRRQIVVLERQLGADARVRFVPEDRALPKASVPGELSGPRDRAGRLGCYCAGTASPGLPDARRESPSLPALTHPEQYDQMRGATCSVDPSHRAWGRPQGPLSRRSLTCG